MLFRRTIVAVLLAFVLAPLATATDGAASPITDDTALYVRTPELAVGISYATAFTYSMLTMRGVINGMDDDLYRGLLIGIPTATAVGSYFLWDALDWKAERSGFMTLGSLGGALAGFVVSGILDYAVGGIVLAGAVGGQATAIALTTRMSDEGAIDTAR
jgi:hypothetical protein